MGPELSDPVSREACARSLRRNQKAKPTPALTVVYFVLLSGS